MNLNYYDDGKILDEVRKMRPKFVSQRLFKEVFLSSEKTKLSTFELDEEEIENIWKDLERKFRVYFRKEDKEEIVLVQDLITAVYLRINKNIV